LSLVDNPEDQRLRLHESEQLFRLLVQGVRDCAIYMLDKEGRVTNWNSGAELIKGYKAEEIVGEHFSRFYTEEDRRSGIPQQALETALREGKFEREAWRVRKDGSLFWAQVLIDPIYNEAGEHVGFAKITRDATERKKAEEELEETRAALAQAQKLQALGELAGGVAHDFNNLMTVIVGAADFLRRRPELPGDKRQQYVDAIYETGVRATKLTDQLLAFGRRRPLRPEVIDVNALIDAVSDLLRRTLGSRIQVELKLAEDAGRIEVDPTQLETAILNAAINARDAMPAGGKLIVSTGRERVEAEDYIRIDVSDTGLGMPQRVVERAFDPFFTTKEVGAGTGLGLSQVHGFAAQAGGRAELMSTEGLGTTLSIFLPRSGKEITHREDKEDAAPLPKQLRVLLVEDNPQVRAFADDLLADLGCNVLCAGCADDALATLGRNEVDVVLSDIVMPGMSGIELANRIAELHPSLPVVLATGYSEQAAHRTQARPILMKPYSARELSAALAKVVRPQA
jgi:PAS domain S-box-containing protein